MPKLTVGHREYSANGLKELLYRFDEALQEVARMDREINSPEYEPGEDDPEVGEAVWPTDLPNSAADALAEAQLVLQELVKKSVEKGIVDDADLNVSS